MRFARLQPGLLAALVGAAFLLPGCAASAPAASVAPATGRIEVAVAWPGPVRQLLATVADVVSLRVSLYRPYLEGMSQEVHTTEDLTREAWDAGLRSLAFDGLPPGSYRVHVMAMDARSKVGESQVAEVELVAGQVAEVALPVFLLPTYGARRTLDPDRGRP